MCYLTQTSGELTNRIPIHLILKLPITEADGNSKRIGLDLDPLQSFVGHNTMNLSFNKSI